MKRLDLYLVESGNFSTRNKSQMAITNGDVTVNSQVVTKNGFIVTDQDKIEVVNSLKYVSRSGLKLELALETFNIDIDNKVALDIGASTGGFTDCLLQNGAQYVYAVDVGTNQLVSVIKDNPKVESREGVNCRYLSINDFDKRLDLVVVDVSFISCTLLLEAISNLLPTQKELIVLIKPQFEVGPKYINKHGIVNNSNAIISSIENCIRTAKKHSLIIQNIIPSSLKGKQGNQEYLAYFIKDGNYSEFDIKSILYK